MKHSPFFAAVLTTLLPSLALADATPLCVANVSAAPFLNESFTGSVAVTNGGTNDPGFQPVVELFLPEGVTLSAATFFGVGVAFEEVGTFSVGTPSLTHPLTGESITGTIDETFVLITIPTSAQTPGSPTLTVDLTFGMDTTLSPDAPTTIGASCVYAFGELDAENNPGVDPPLRTDSGGASFTPKIMTVSKAVSKPATVTGPDNPVTWTVTIDVADGQTVESARLIDIIEDQFQIDAIAATVGFSANTTLPGAADKGGTVDITLDAIVGVVGADALITIDGFVPDTDASGADILDPATGKGPGGGLVAIDNTATVSARLDLDRLNFGVGANMPDESNLAFAVGVSIDLTATRQGDTADQ